MDADGERLEVRVVGADINAAVVGRCLMQADEVAAIEGERGPRLADGERQDVFIRYGLSGLAAFVSGQQVVANSRKASPAGSGKFSLA